MVDASPDHPPSSRSPRLDELLLPADGRTSHDTDGSSQRDQDRILTTRLRRDRGSP
jgi:hypothetical protein